LRRSLSISDLIRNCAPLPKLPVPETGSPTIGWDVLRSEGVAFVKLSQRAFDCAGIAFGGGGFVSPAKHEMEISRQVMAQSRFVFVRISPELGAIANRSGVARPSGRIRDKARVLPRLMIRTLLHRTVFCQARHWVRGFRKAVDLIRWGPGQAEPIPQRLCKTVHRFDDSDPFDVVGNGFAATMQAE
jgi:hypothetical protein